MANEEHEEAPLERIAKALDSIALSLLKLAKPPMLGASTGSGFGHSSDITATKKIFSSNDGLPDSQAEHALGKSVT